MNISNYTVGLAVKTATSLYPPHQGVVGLSLVQDNL